MTAKRPLVYDAGALIAADRGSGKMRAAHEISRVTGVRPLVPGPVVTQAWRGGSRSARMAYLLGQCTIVKGLEEDDYREAGTLVPRLSLPRKKSFDFVDMMVAMVAKQHNAASIVTSDRKDLLAYLEVLGFPCDVLHVLAGEQRSTRDSAAVMNPSATAKPTTANSRKAASREK